jgi:branched-chain amino acid transport system permease protein
MRRFPPDRRGAAALIVLAALAPLAVGAGSDLLDDMVLAAAYAVMALGLNVVVGFAGLLDLGYVAFFAIGAYTAAYLATGYRGIHLSFLLVLVAAAGATMLAGALIGIPTLRLRGDYIAVVTLAFGEIIGEVVLNGKDIPVLGGTLTSGPIGIGPIDRIDLPLLPPFEALDLRPWYWFALALVLLVLAINVRLRGSRLGRAWIALRDDEDAAASAGVPIARTKLLAYGTGAALGGMAGAFLASYLAIVNPIQFQFSFSILIFSMVVLGGLGSVRGVVAGAVVLSLVNNLLLPRAGALDFDLTAISSGVYGAILVLVMLLRPAGLLPATLSPSSNRGAGEIARLR